MISDPTLLFRAQRNAYTLFGYDAVIPAFNTTLEAEACGCSTSWEDNTPKVANHPLLEGLSIKDLETIPIETKGQLPTILETAKRLSMVLGREVALFSVITGPLTLAQHLKGPTFIADVKEHPQKTTELIGGIARLLLRLCRTCCELGTHVIIAEEILGKLQPDSSKLIAPFLQTSSNIAKFYDVATVLLAKGCSTGHVEPLCRLETDAVVISGQIDFEYFRSCAMKYNRCYGIALPSSAFLGTLVEAKEAIESSLKLTQKRGSFICTEAEVPYGASVDNMHEIMKALSRWMKPN